MAIRSVSFKGQIREILVVFSRIKKDRGKRFINPDGHPNFDVQELPDLT